MVAVVQLVERQIVILVVVGSSPIGHPIHSFHSWQRHLMAFNMCSVSRFYYAKVAELVDALVLGTSIL